MKTLGELIRWRAGQHPERVALDDGGRQTTHAEIDRRASQVAGALIAAGVEFADGPPCNPTGKLRRRELRERYWKDRDRRVS